MVLSLLALLWVLSAGVVWLHSARVVMHRVAERERRTPVSAIPRQRRGERTRRRVD